MSHSDHSVEASTTSPLPEGIVHSSANRWLLLDANRWLVAGLFVAVAFAAFLVSGLSGLVDPGSDDPATLLLSVLISGNLTLVPITITINQLVLSREFGKPHELRGRDEGIRQLRDDLKTQADIGLIPPQPSAFVRTLVETLRAGADAVAEAAADTGDPDLARRGDLLRDEVVESTEGVLREVDASEFGSYDLLAALMRVNSAWLVETVQYLEHDCGEGAPDEPFDRLQETLRLFNVTRQYAKTLYGQKEIATLSRLLLYVGFVAVLAASLVMLGYAGPVEESLSDVETALGFALLGALVFSPLAFLLSYMLRLSTLMSYPPLRNSFITDG
ncbi:hypothetical protein [Halosimplex halophilum]|uniref:hypothetical protein n=1 Tax=Halosimplex halophilum TaxID=2559572 RepID=UPI0014354B29|nr:hypothetical protein [Halosimplex halophilum]